MITILDHYHILAPNSMIYVTTYPPYETVYEAVAGMPREIGNLIIV